MGVFVCLGVLVDCFWPHTFLKEHKLLCICPRAHPYGIMKKKDETVTPGEKRGTALYSLYILYNGLHSSHLGDLQKYGDHSFQSCFFPKYSNTY